MGKKKKSKKAIAKRKAEKKLRRKKRKRQIKMQKVDFGRAPSSLLPTSEFFRPALADIEPPEGFRAVGMAQGMIEFAKPIMEWAEEQGKDVQDAFQLATLLWNMAISGEKGMDLDIEPDLIQALMREFQLTKREAHDFVNEMIRRKKHLFPEDVQPGFPTIMFMRKEGHYEITRFDYDQLSLSEAPLPPDEADTTLVEAIQRMDRYILANAEYDEWEAHFFKMQDQCRERFTEWLSQKGVERFVDEFPFCVQIYVNFVYQYVHGEPVTLRTVRAVELEEFFTDFVLRKATVEPHEYTYWPPAMKLFYRFLQEKGYLDDAAPFIQLIDEVEPEYIEILQKRY